MGKNVFTELFNTDRNMQSIGQPHVSRHADYTLANVFRLLEERRLCCEQYLIAKTHESEVVQQVCMENFKRINDTIKILLKL